MVPLKMTGFCLDFCLLPFSIPTACPAGSEWLLHSNASMSYGVNQNLTHRLEQSYGSQFTVNEKSIHIIVTHRGLGTFGFYCLIVVAAYKCRNCCIEDVCQQSKNLKHVSCGFGTKQQVPWKFISNQKIGDIQSMTKYLAKLSPVVLKKPESIPSDFIALGKEIFILYIISKDFF